MTEFDLKWSEKSIKEYVVYQIFGSTAMLIALIVLFSVSMLFVPAFGLIAYIMSSQSIALIIGIACFVLGIFMMIALFVVVNVTAKRTSKSLSDNKDIVCAVSDNDLILIRNGMPMAVIDWDKVEDIYESKSAFFVMTKDKLLLALEKDAVRSGVLSEAQEVLKIKSEKLEKNDK